MQEKNTKYIFVTGGEKMTVMKQELAKLAQTESLLAREAELEANARDRRMGHEEEAHEQIWNLRWSIAKGKSTGDKILDLKLMIWGNAHKDKTYDRLLMAQDVLSACPGELICWDGQEIGLLPEKPVLTCAPAEAGGKGENKTLRYLPEQVEIPVQRYFKTSDKPGFFSVDCCIDIPAKSFDYYELIGKGVLIIGNKKVEEWFRGLDCHINSLYTVWVSLKSLGHRFEPTPELAKEIRNRQDSSLVLMHERVVILQELCHKFDVCRSHPLQAVREDKGVEILDNADGCRIKFRVVDQIDEQIGKIRSLMEDAEDLEMEQVSSAYRELVKRFAALVSQHQMKTLQRSEA